jgi:hypothetical protein
MIISSHEAIFSWQSKPIAKFFRITEISIPNESLLYYLFNYLLNKLNKQYKCVSLNILI